MPCVAGSISIDTKHGVITGLHVLSCSSVRGKDSVAAGMVLMSVGQKKSCMYMNFIVRKPVVRVAI